MIADTAAWDNGLVLSTEFCVVGAGPAGITLALTLAERGCQVLLLESGQRPLDPQAQARYAGEVDGGPLGAQAHSPPDRFRMRGLGGSSIRWGGRCMPMDPIDFEPRPWVAWSGWPIGPQDLAPYWAPAGDWAEAGSGIGAIAALDTMGQTTGWTPRDANAGPDAYDARRALPGAPPLIAGFDSKRVHTHGLERFSCPTDFGRRYRRRLAQAPTLQVLQGATCTHLRLSADGRRVQSLRVCLSPSHGRGRGAGDPRGQRCIEVRARQVLLAAGGLETARLLLDSDEAQPGGVGNARDLVGRFYMCHLAANLGELQLTGGPERVRHGYEISPEGVYCRRRLAIAPEAQREHRLLNAVARLHLPPIADPRHGSGALSALYLARPFISHEYGRRLGDEVALGLGARALRWGSHAKNLVTDAPATAAFLGHWLLRRTLATRKFPSVILPNRRNRFSLELQAEQVPHPDSRVTLSDTRDALGQRRLQVGWRHQAQDVASVAHSLAIMAAEIARHGVGTLRWSADRLPADLLRYGAMAATTWAPPAWGGTRAAAWSTRSAGCTASTTCTSPAARSSRPRARPTPRSPSWRWRCVWQTTWYRQSRRHRQRHWHTHWQQLLLRSRRSALTAMTAHTPRKTRAAPRAHATRGRSPRSAPDPPHGVPHADPDPGR